MSHRSKSRRTQKRQRFVETETRKRLIKPGPVIGALGVIIVGLLGYVALADSSKSKPITEVTSIPVASSSGAQISIPLENDHIQIASAFEREPILDKKAVLHPERGRDRNYEWNRQA